MKKHTIAKRAAAFALAAVMTAGLFGCGEEAASGSGSAAASGGGGSASGTGRWRQEEVTPGENARSYEKPVLLEDGSLLLLEKGGDNTATLWTSTDNGATWQEQPTDWAQQTGADYFGVTRLMPDGGCFITAVTETDGGYDQTWWVQDAGSSALRRLELPESILDVSDLQPLGGGEALLLGRILVPAAEDAPSTLVDENGMMSAMSAWKLDLATGECTEMTELLGGLGGSYISGMAADPTEPGAFYSLSYQESGVQLMRTGTDGAMTTVFENLPDASDAAFSACADSDGNYYYASQKGIYRLAKGGDLAELVVDGAGTVLSAGSASLMGLARCADGGFLAVTLESTTDDQNNTAYGGHVYRIFWDETAPARGSGDTLMVWSLENSDTVRAAINEYEAQYPERTVDYQIALESGGSTADAITALNTALLAGSGPDVIILDGLDWRAYQERGLLEDLSAWVDTQSLVSNVAAPFVGQDGSVYALPARFAVPVLVGTEADLAAASSLESLAGWLLEKAARPAWDCQSNDYYEPLDEPYGLGFISIQQLLDFALETSAPALTENGVNGEAVAQVLDFVQQVGDYYGMDGYKNLMTNAVVAGDAGGEAVIAVPQKAEGIERRGGGESPALPELFEQEGGERRAEYGGGEIPEVVKGALEEELREEAAQRELFQVPGIDVYGQVQGDAGEVDDGALFQEGAGAARVAEDEKAAGHEKERHRRACDLAREYEIRRGAVGGEGRGVYGHDEQRGGDAEEVDAPVSARAHAGSLHSVRM